MATTKVKPKVIHQRYPYQFIECGTLDNGKPDYRIQKYNWVTKRYSDIYKLDNSIQLATCLDDHDYVLWLDDQPCYRGRRGNSVSNHYSS